jgi:hypothetical protein
MSNNLVAGLKVEVIADGNLLKLHVSCTKNVLPRPGRGTHWIVNVINDIVQASFEQEPQDFVYKSHEIHPPTIQRMVNPNSFVIELGKGICSELLARRETENG